MLPPTRLRRLANPWLALAEYAGSLDVECAEEHVHSHIPYGEWCKC